MTEMASTSDSRRSGQTARAAAIWSARLSGPVRPSGRPSPARAAAAALLLAPAEPRRQLRVVERKPLSPEQRRRRTRTLLALGGSAVVVIVFSLVYIRVVLAERQITVDRLTAQVASDQATYQRLRLEVAELGSPQNIISVAEGRLGMRAPASVTYLTPKTVAPGTVDGSTSGAANPPGRGPSVVQAPSGDANWPEIKSQLAGSP